MIAAVFLLAATVENCPAIDIASVRSAVGEAQVKVLQAEKDAGYTCQFAGPAGELTVEVKLLPGAGEFVRFKEGVCQGGRDLAQVKATGNEAMACSFGSEGKLEERLVGRVRNKGFVIRLVSNDKNTSAKTLRQTCFDIAQLVSGNLF